MIELLHQIEQIDTQIFLFFNGFHNVYWDYFMMIFSDRFVWVPFYVTSGRATSSMEYDHHAPLSSTIAKAVLEEVKGHAELL